MTTRKKKQPVNSVDDNDASGFYSTEEGMSVDFSDLKEKIEELLKDQEKKQVVEQFLASFDINDLLQKIMSGDPAQIEEVVRSVKKYYEALAAPLRPAINALPSITAIPAHKCAAVIAIFFRLYNAVYEEKILLNERLKALELHVKWHATILEEYLDTKLFTRDEAFVLTLATISKGPIVLNPSHIAQNATLDIIPKMIGAQVRKPGKKQ